MKEQFLNLTNIIKYLERKHSIELFVHEFMLRDEYQEQPPSHFLIISTRNELYAKGEPSFFHLRWVEQGKFQEYTYKKDNANTMFSPLIFHENVIKLTKNGENTIYVSWGGLQSFSHWVYLEGLEPSDFLEELEYSPEYEVSVFSYPYDRVVFTEDDFNTMLEEIKDFNIKEKIKKVLELNISNRNIQYFINKKHS